MDNNIYFGNITVKLTHLRGKRKEYEFIECKEIVFSHPIDCLSVLTRKYRDSSMALMLVKDKLAVIHKVNTSKIIGKKASSL